MAHPVVGATARLLALWAPLARGKESGERRMPPSLRQEAPNLRGVYIHCCGRGPHTSPLQMRPEVGGGRKGRATSGTHAFQVF